MAPQPAIFIISGSGAARRLNKMATKDTPTGGEGGRLILPYFMISTRSELRLGLRSRCNRCRSRSQGQPLALFPSLSGCLRLGGISYRRLLTIYAPSVYLGDVKEGWKISLAERFSVRRSFG